MSRKPRKLHRKVTLRFYAADATLHRRLARRAKDAGQTLNEFILSRLRGTVKR
jgi:predicted HicB family RNase H-like nuclease